MKTVDFAGIMGVRSVELQPLSPQRKAGIQKALASVHKSDALKQEEAALHLPTRLCAEAMKQLRGNGSQNGTGSGVGAGPDAAGRAGIDRGGAVHRTRQLDRDRGVLYWRRRRHDLGREPGTTTNCGWDFVPAGNNHAGEGSSGSGIGQREGSIMSSDMLTI
jgi:hypothetical protein